ncbi:MAG: tyrosine-protein phosphatase [Lachnospiraceae bacterium]|nr:tyrosine-protein phosphatase [Lachnospiraceae bacterium]
MTSQKLSFEKLNNTRDLGGMLTQGGCRIKFGKLIRSGHLFAASESDKVSLFDRVSLIVDFRTDKEREEKPDPVPEHTACLHLPIIKSLTEGITREKAAVEATVKDLSHDPEEARQYMMHMYTNFVTSEFAVAQYAEFMRLLCEEREGAVLWHCTAGKDRAGFAAVLILEILGVSREDIFEDYLLTNECQKEEVAGLIQMIQKQNSGNAVSEEALRFLFSAKEEYLMALYQKIDEIYGNFDNFAQKGLRIDRKKQELLRKIYVE